MSTLVPYSSPLTGNLLTLTGGELVSESERFPVVNGIPRFVPENNYAAAFGLQWKTFTKTQLDSHSQLDITRERLVRCLGMPLEALKGKTVLEVGCGAGRFTELLVESGAMVHSIDLSVAVEANKANIGNPSNYTIAQASVYDLPFHDHSFDIVICLGVIQHTPSSEKTIQSLWEKVKPGGLLVIDHYRWRLSYYSTLKPVYRHVLRKMKPEKSKRAVDRLVDFFFPMHWALRNIKPAWWLIHRISPLIEYIHLFPEKDYDFHLEWSRLDSYDSLTDYYKHLRTEGQIRKLLESFHADSIWVARGGNGVEARCTKSAS
ncbi:MAG: class I SAM-dependent methyltransferase [Bacteroidota bacterium]